ncbi:phospholipid/glycerol acyltransferase [Sulfuricella denitrificans skB26]|uniref:Phospholipid/glycerol acyltransferase n=1 Tax=Sulfuricella denitrificans (strain DSM 22764 / NBRC 105220 / skB26) TaxID=1163617 RepID=S6B823_SULDS|nr:lysophospholipid acyltransferase family protein [Sulfuricella denitrificans]BAN36572.1 phospholipid/glycerol acyltransferase [Sulfuricella denitrificans skB26]
MHDTSWERPLNRSNGVLTRNWRLVRLVLHLLVGVVKAALLLPLVGRARRTELIRRWSVRVLAILNVRLSVRGKVPDISAAGVMFVANHISWLDIYLLDAVCPVRFVSKAEVRAWPVIGWLAVKIGTLFIERTRRHDTARAGREVVDALMQGDCVAVFPEGTTSNGTLLRPFHASLLQSAINSGAPLWPVAIRYLHRDGTANLSPAYVDEMSFADSLFRILNEPELVAEIAYLELLPVQGRSRRELAALAEQAIANALNLSAPCRKSDKSVDPPAVLP